MVNNIRLLFEALAVGLILSFVSSIIFFVPLPSFAKPFVAGVLVHYLCEYTTINKLYCTMGNACTVP